MACQGGMAQYIQHKNCVLIKCLEILFNKYFIIFELVRFIYKQVKLNFDVNLIFIQNYSATVLPLILILHGGGQYPSTVCFGSRAKSVGTVNEQ